MLCGVKAEGGGGALEHIGLMSRKSETAYSDILCNSVLIKSRMT